MANFIGVIYNPTNLFNSIKSGFIASSPIHIGHVGVGVRPSITSLFNVVKAGYDIPKPPAPLIPNHLFGTKIQATSLFNKIKLSEASNKSQILGHNFEGQKINKRLKLIKG